MKEVPLILNALQDIADSVSEEDQELTLNIVSDLLVRMEKEGLLHRDAHIEAFEMFLDQDNDDLCPKLIEAIERYLEAASAEHDLMEADIMLWGDSANG